MFFFSGSDGLPYIRSGIMCEESLSDFMSAQNIQYPFANGNHRSPKVNLTDLRCVYSRNRQFTVNDGLCNRFAKQLAYFMHKCLCINWPQ